MTTYSELITYFETFKTEIPGIKSVIVGEDEAIMNEQSSGIRYPAMWAETPDVQFVGDDENPQTRFDFLIGFVTNEPRNTNTDANARMSEMLELAKLAYAKIYNDSDNGGFELILGKKDATPIRRWSGDNVYGWRLAVTIALDRCLCDDCD